MAVAFRLMPPDADRRGRLAGALFGAALTCGMVALPVIGRAQDRPAAAAANPADVEVLERDLRRSTLEQSRLRLEIDGLRSDRQRLNQDLLATAGRLRQAENRLAAAEARLAELNNQEAALRRSLQARRGTIVAVLSALQRVGRKPPPAVLVRPEDILKAIRASILFGAVLPELRNEARTLVIDLEALVRLATESAAEFETIRGERDGMAGERARLAALIEARQRQISQSEEALANERRRAGEIAAQAQSLKELISRSEGELSGAARAIALARNAPAPVRTPQQVAALSAEAFKDVARLSPRIAFPDARGLVALPVAGTISKAFGAPDGFGGQERGVTMTAASEAVVTAPADGWIAFAGPYRTYGHLLIMNVGNGYHVVVAGMQRTDVDIGQFVLAGEPVGVMGATPAPRSDGEIASPQLYIEFRKDGAPIDPGPWWIKQGSSEKARG